MAKTKKRLLGIVLLVLLTAFLCPLTAAAAQTDGQEQSVNCYTPGDVNADGEVTNKDAIYTLYHAFFGNDKYPVGQDCDFNGDGSVDRGDAIQVLWNLHHPELYPLNGDGHCYYAPVLEVYQQEGALHVRATLSCGCKDETATKVLDILVGSGEPVELDGYKLDVKEDVTEPTCVGAGQRKLTITLEQGGQKLEKIETLPVPAAGHDFAGGVEIPTCETGVQCQREGCAYSIAALGHNWVKDPEQCEAATCEAVGTDVYTCANEGCSGTKAVELPRTSHQMEYLEDRLDEAYPHTTCRRYVKYYRCAVCGYTAEGAAETDAFIEHSHKAEITTAATCTAAGVMTYRCECGDSYTNEIPRMENHSWTTQETEAGLITTCATCGATKVDATGAVSKDVLAQENVVLDLGGDVSVSMDDGAKAAIEEGQSIDVTVTPVAPEALSNVPEEVKEQIGGSVYDLSMVYAETGEKVDFSAGMVTVTLPYTLQEGDDVDSINVWYIDDVTGEIRAFKGTYSNGYVTFETNHFSYYTVTRLKPAQRCALYGHNYVTSYKAATCTEDGFTKKVCTRCGEAPESENQLLQRIPHSYAQTTKPTCTEAGVLTCTGCLHTMDVPALGHQMAEESYEPATCMAPGIRVERCENGCGHAVTTEFPQLPHNPQLAETVPATCTTGGYELHRCVCGEETVKNETAPLGHNFRAIDAEFEWEPGYGSCTVYLVCANDRSHTEVLLSVKNQVEVDEDAATCLGNGAITYTASASLNKTVYSDTVTLVVQAPGHKPDREWLTNEGQHYRQCKICGERMEAASHSWNDGVVTKEPTCTETGVRTLSCLVCKLVKEEVLPATGVHDFVDGVCALCGMVSSTCDHNPVYATQVDVSAYHVCEDLLIRKYSCDCGLSQNYSLENSTCTFEYVGEEEIEEDGIVKRKERYVCSRCGLIQEYTEYHLIDEKACLATNITERAFIFGDAVIVDYLYAEIGHSHPSDSARSVTTVLTMAEHGICGTTFEHYECYCGGWVMNRMSEGGCNWEPKDENSSMEYVCTVCGAEKIHETVSVRDPATCETRTTETVTISANGEVIYTHASKYSEAFHPYELSGHEMKGKSCEDGVVLIFTCPDCGKSFESYHYGYHPVMVETEVDLTGAAICDSQLIQQSCFCGECYQYSLRGSCDWSHVFTGGNTEKWECGVCGATKTIVTNEGEKDSACNLWVTRTETLMDGSGKVLASARNHYKDRRHNTLEKCVLAEGSKTCEDGAYVMSYCADCGMELNSYYVEWHATCIVESKDISAMGSCMDNLALRSCACGQVKDFCYGYADRSCEWNWFETEQGEIEKCVNCGMSKTAESRLLGVVDVCRDMYRETWTLTMESGESVSMTVDRISEHHREVFQLTLHKGAASCDEGYTVKALCKDCGVTNQWDTGGHADYLLDREYISQGELCGDVEAVTRGCACGETSTGLEWTSGSWCQFDGWDEERNAQVCIHCGALLFSGTERIKVEGETCKYQNVEHMIFEKDGVELFRFDSVSEYVSHSYVPEFDLQGETCEDGVIATITCADCGNSYTEEWYHHQENAICDQNLAELGLCQGSIKAYTCACGENSYLDYWHDCSMEYVGQDEATGLSVHACYQCGARWYMAQIGSKDENCNYSGEEIVKVEMGGQLVVDVSISKHEVRHRYQFTSAELMDGAVTCEDGVIGTMTCADCGNSYTEEWYHHQDNAICDQNLAELGLCQGRVTTWTCACGENSYLDYWNDCSMEFVSKDEATGLNMYSCYQCGARWYTGYVGTKDENCNFDGEQVVRIEKDGVELVDQRIHVIRNSFHNHQITGAVLEEGATSCEEGVTVIRSCTDCPDMYTVIYYHHERIVTAEVNLNRLGACGGSILADNCACGNEGALTSRNWHCEMETDYWDSYGSNLQGNCDYQMTCQKCGLVYRVVENWLPVEGKCLVRYSGVVTLSRNGEVAEMPYSYTREEHQWADVAYSLLEGSVTCEDGLLAVQSCKNCGIVNQWEEHWHGINRVEAVDLSQYGAVCGTEFVKFQCPCGKEMRYDIVGECDIDNQWTEEWGSWLNDWQQHSQGSSSAYSQAHMLTCAVTDPVACGLKIRMAEYWVQADGCVAVEYQTWQFGYDEQTGTWQDEITVATGQRQIFHSYTRTDINEDQGNGVMVNGSQYTCSVCGSTWIERYTYENGTHVRTETICQNPNDNTYWYDLYEWGLVRGDYCYETLYRYEQTRADGSQWWYQNAYTYDFENGCIRTCTYTDSNGTESIHEETAHMTSGQPLKMPTCTQYGEYTEICAVCDQTFGTWENEPMDHEWLWNEDKQSYYCGRCGLENVNGASGVMVMEDMTASYGNGTHYVVGYWNRENAQFVCNVTVILDEVTGGMDDQILLNDIAFNTLNWETDGLTAISFSMSETQAAAEAAMAELGYTGGYAIRFSFVPVNAGDDLDYAITFDSLNAAQ